MFFNFIYFALVFEILCILSGVRGMVLPKTLKNSNPDKSEGIHLSSRTRRSAVLQRSWTRNGNNGIVFVYSDEFPSEEVSRILSAAAELAKYACIPVNVYSNTKFWSGGGTSQRLFRNYVYITRKWYGGCNADIGMAGGRQRFNLDPALGCALRKWTILHEMVHSIGLDHEQNRPDRNNFVRINFENIMHAQQYNFLVKPSSQAIGPYDYDSIMHYPATSFAINPRYSTISSIRAGYRVPQAPPTTLSKTDKEKIRVITGCKNTLF